MANGKNQNKLEKKLKVLDTILIISLLLLCISSLLLAIITLVSHISTMVSILGIITILTAVALIVIFIADIVLGIRSIDSGKRIVDAPEPIDGMTGVQFENYVAERLIAAGWTDVELTPASGDHGVDVLCSNEGIRYAIQCKRYKSLIDTKAVQEVYTGRGIYDADRAVVITNSTFTRQAREMAEKLDVELWNVKKLEELIRLKNE